MRLPPQAFGLLELLVSNAGRLVTREEIKNAIWTDTFVDFERGINKSIRQIRDALGDDAEAPKFIETHRGHGYRFIGELTENAQNWGREHVATLAATGPSGELASMPAPPALVSRFRKSVLGVLAASVVVIFILTAWVLHGRYPPRDQMLRASPLTTYLGTQDWPSLSPDGSQVAFAWDGEKQDNFDIYVKRIGSGPPLRLTRDPAADTAPAWSPDESSIAFLRASRPGRSAVVLVSPLGGPERVVGEVTRFEPMNQALSWSPDSKWLAAFDRPPAQPAGLWLLSVETGERRRLTTTPDEWTGDFAPAFAPDGRFLAFRRLVARNSLDVFWLALGSDMRPRGEPRRLTRDNQVFVGLAWAADGKDLIFSSGSPGNLSLFRMGISEVAPRRLTGQGEILNVTVAARSNRLVYAQSRREMDIYRAKLNGGGTEASDSIPLIASSRLERYPSYSPDGKKIAFVSLRSGNWQLWVADGDGQNAAQMTSFQRGEVAFPAWSADGKQIGFMCDAEGSQQAYEIDANGGKPRRLAALGLGVFALRWSRDGRMLFFGSNRSGAQQLWKIPAGGGAPDQMTRQGAVTGPILESPDGKLLYYVRPGGVWSVPVAGGPERQVIASEVDPGALDGNQHGIYFHANSNVTKNGDLMFYRFPNGPITKVAGVEMRYGMSLSPDGRYMLYTKMTSTGSDLMLVENFR
ncbi:MAG TPA: winged helix-turn-helix domain-containing protein [Bryobacteraceae bacterium]|nr:winged helix-turn-helix domain-containing protein [Bryobacteraceae bacterium]